jgi:hypothetical protein
MAVTFHVILKSALYMIVQVVERVIRILLAYPLSHLVDSLDGLTE